MAGQGYHLGLASMMANKEGKELSAEMRIGVLVIDALSSVAGGRRYSHFTGGAGCIIPDYMQLRQISKLQSWDSGYKKSYLVDPETNLELFEVANIHIPEGEYKQGMRMHLLGDIYYDELIQKKLFDVSRQQEGIIIYKKTGEEMDGATFRKELYSAYPLLDQYFMNLAGITNKYVQETKDLLYATFNDQMATFVSKYLNFSDDFEWKDTKFFKKAEIDELIDNAIKNGVDYLKSK